MTEYEACKCVLWRLLQEAKADFMLKKRRHKEAVANGEGEDEIRMAREARIKAAVRRNQLDELLEYMDVMVDCTMLGIDFRSGMPLS